MEMETNRENGTREHSKRNGERERESGEGGGGGLVSIDPPPFFQLEDTRLMLTSPVTTSRMRRDTRLILRPQYPTAEKRDRGALD